MNSLLYFLYENQYDSIMKKKCHKKASLYYNKWNNILTLPVILLSTFTGSTIMSSEDNQIYMNYITSSFGIIIALLTSINRYFNFSKLSEYHNNISKMYDELNRDIEFFIQENDVNKSEEIREFIKEIHRKIENIENENTFDVPQFIYEMIIKYENKKNFIREKLSIHHISDDNLKIERQSSFKDIIEKKNKLNKKIKIDIELKNIAIIDDNEIHIELMKKILSEHYNVYDYKNSEDFWKDYNKLNYDIVILDYLLPNENGIDIAKQIIKKNRNIKIICVTAFDDIEEICKENGIKYIYYKPILKKKFLNYIKNIIINDYSSTTIEPNPLVSV